MFPRQLFHRLTHFTDVQCVFVFVCTCCFWTYIPRLKDNFYFPLSETTFGCPVGTDAGLLCGWCERFWGRPNDGILLHSVWWRASLLVFWSMNIALLYASCVLSHTEGNVWEYEGTKIIFSSIIKHTRDRSKGHPQQCLLWLGPVTISSRQHTCCRSAVALTTDHSLPVTPTSWLLLVSARGWSMA